MGRPGRSPRRYLDIAKDQITKVWNHEIYDYKLAGAGDIWGDWSNINISYFAPATTACSTQVDTDPTHDWNAVIETATTPSPAR